MPSQSRYVLLVENLSSRTGCSDLRYRLKHVGQLYRVERLKNETCALVEFRRSADADYAWHNFDGLLIDRQRVKIDWATRADFKDFCWKWFEGSSPIPSPKRFRSRSRSKAPSPSASFQSWYSLSSKSH